LTPANERRAIIIAAGITAVATISAALITRPNDRPGSDQRDGPAPSAATPSEVPPDVTLDATAGNLQSRPGTGPSPVADHVTEPNPVAIRRVSIAGCWTDEINCMFRVAQEGVTYRYRGYCGGEHLSSGEGTVVDGITSSEGVYRGRRTRCSGQISEDGNNYSATCSRDGETTVNRLVRMQRCPATP
jgi:hypothetical protein